MANINENLAIIDEFTARLQDAVIGAEQTTTKHQYWTEGPHDGTIETQQGPMKTLRGLIADWQTDADVEVANAISGYDGEISLKLEDYDLQFIQHLLTIGFEPAVQYAAGINISRYSQTVTFDGLTYYWVGVLPYTTTGNFNTETDWLIAPVTGGIEIPKGSFASGVTLTRKAQTVSGPDGEWYIWEGDFPKVVTSGSSVQSSGGTGDGLFKLVSGVPPLRFMLSILAASTGTVLNSGSFEFGASVPSPNHSLLSLGTGKIYSWKGAVPKVVDANSTPMSSGGISESGWVEIVNLGSVGGTVISESPPPNPSIALEWIRCSDLKSFFWYVDDAGGQWVDKKPSIGGVVATGATGTFVSSDAQTISVVNGLIISII